MLTFSGNLYYTFVLRKWSLQITIISCQQEHILPSPIDNTSLPNTFPTPWTWLWQRVINYHSKQDVECWEMAWRSFYRFPVVQEKYFCKCSRCLYNSSLILILIICNILPSEFYSRWQQLTEGGNTQKQWEVKAKGARTKEQGKGTRKNTIKERAGVRRNKGTEITGQQLVTARGLISERQCKAMTPGRYAGLSVTSHFWKPLLE